jgi:hypothetical protein
VLLRVHTSDVLPTRIHVSSALYRSY